METKREVRSKRERRIEVIERETEQQQRHLKNQVVEGNI